MGFYFPDAHRQIDWARGHDFHDTELRQVVRDAELGRRYADVLARVTLRDGQPRWVYVHVEVQGQADSDFARRMFTYNYRLYDRYAVPIASLALLADDDASWRPADFGFEVLGCRHQLRFPVVKLLDWADQTLTLESDPNPFALVTLAHLRTRATRGDSESRYQAKRTLVRLLYQRRWERQRILDLFAILDWMMRLTPALERQLWQDIKVIEGEYQMRYVTSIERMAIERGFSQGYLQGAQYVEEKGRLEGKLEGKLEGNLEGNLEGKLEGQAILLERQNLPIASAPYLRSFSNDSTRRPWNNWLIGLSGYWMPAAWKKFLAIIEAGQATNTSITIPDADRWKEASDEHRLDRGQPT